MLKAFRILHICDRLHPGGITTFVNSLLTLNKNHPVIHDVMLIFDHETPSLREHSTIYCLRYNKKNHFTCIRHFGEIAKTYDAVMIHAAHPIVVFPLLWLKKKCFLFQHGMSVSHGALVTKIFKRFWFSLIPILLGANVVCSTEFAFQKTRRLGIFLQKKRCLIIPFGIQLNGHPLKSNTRKPNGAIRIGMAGRLASQKRQDWVLQSLLTYSGDTQIHLKIAGSGPLLNSLKDLGKKIESNNILVEFLGNLNNDDMKAFYNKLDLFVFPSKDESFGLVLLEALSHWVPVAVFKDVGGCLSVVQDRANGFVLQNGIRGLEELWKTLDKDSRILAEQRQFISTMDLHEYDTSHTRAKLDSTVCDWDAPVNSNS